MKLRNTCRNWVWIIGMLMIMNSKDTKDQLYVEDGLNAIGNS